MIFNNQPYHYLIIGAGAIGTYFGGSLLLGGQKVTFVERGSAALKIKQDGIILQIKENQHKIYPVNVVTDLKNAIENNVYDIAIVAMKSYDTAKFVHELITKKITLPPILCLQNGVENEAEFVKIIGEKDVVYGSVTTAIERIDAGSVKLQRLRGVGLSGDLELCQKLEQVFNYSHLNAEIYPNALSMKWSKLITNLLANASAAILDLKPTEIYSDPDLFHIEVLQIKEALLVMKTLGCEVVDLPGTPVRALVWALISLPEKITKLIIGKALGSGRGGKMPSLYIDLWAGKTQSEVYFLNGAVARIARQLQIPAPVNAVLSELVESKTLEIRSRKFESIQKAELIRKICEWKES